MGQTLVGGSEKTTWLNHDSEFKFRVQRKEQAKPWFSKFAVRRKNLLCSYFFSFSLFSIVFFFIYFFSYIFIHFFSFILFLFFCFLYFLFSLFFSFFSSFFLLFLFFSIFFIIVFFFSFFFIIFFSTEFRERIWSYSEPAEPGFGTALSLNLSNQGLALSFLRTRNLPGFGVRRKELAFFRYPSLLNQGLAWSFLRTPNLSEIGVLRKDQAFP